MGITLLEHLYDEKQLQMFVASERRIPKRKYQLIKNVYDRVTQHPHQFKMHYWVMDAALDKSHVIIDCHTTACVAGWAVMEAKMPLMHDRCGELVPKYYGGHWDLAGQAALGINRAEADYLFNTTKDSAIECLEVLLAEDANTDYRLESTHELAAVSR